jgi:hypothetical protein
MMKLSDTFRHRIVISNPGDILESIDACLAFLESLSLDPNAQQKLANIQYRLQQIEQKGGPSEEEEEKKNIFFGDIIPFLQQIAPVDCYFGSHPQDNRLIGFWENSLRLEKSVPQE